MCNGPKMIYVERSGKLTLSDVTFVDELHLRRIIDKIVAQVGRRIDESSPLCDARLPMVLALMRLSHRWLLVDHSSPFVSSQLIRCASTT